MKLSQASFSTQLLATGTLILWIMAALGFIGLFLDGHGGGILVVGFAGILAFPSIIFACLIRHRHKRDGADTYWDNVSLATLALLLIGTAILLAKFL